jgi:predicted ester cyclase
MYLAMIQMSESEKNKAVVRAYADAFNRGDIEAVCDCFAPEAQVFGVLGWGGLDKAKPIWLMLSTSFQMKLQIDGLCAEDNLVAARYTERGKFVAPFRDFSPTGKTYEVVAMEWFEFSNSLIVRRWGARDSASIYRQLGITPG